MRQESVRYAITSLSEWEASPTAAAQVRRWQRFRGDLWRWSQGGVTHVQLREKGLAAGELFRLVSAGMAQLCALGDHLRPRLLLNGRADIAAAAAADGVHLTSRPGELTPAQVRQVFRSAGLPHCLVSQSCHTLDDVRRAHGAAADLILFGPVREKRFAGERVTPGQGLRALQEACAAAPETPVVALGGLRWQDEAACRAAGAAGMAGIRLFAPA